jgi:hypothetical protein
MHSHWCQVIKKSGGKPRAVASFPRVKGVGEVFPVSIFEIVTKVTPDNSSSFFSVNPLRIRSFLIFNPSMVKIIHTKFFLVNRNFLVDKHFK